MADFFERAEPMFSLYQQGKYADALHLAEELARKYPEQSINTTYWRMCLLARSGQKERALRVMEEAVNEGLWWTEGHLREEIDLKDLQGNPEFERLVSICAQRHNAAQGSAIALLSALRGDIPATAFIAVAPGQMADMADLPALASSARGRGLHGVIVAGGKDPRFEIFTQISETLSAYGIPCQLESRADLGHAYPSDFQEILEKTISSISHKEHE